MNEQNFAVDDLDKLELQLSEEDEAMLQEIANLKSNMPKDKDLLTELIDASVKGTMNYIDSFIDISAIGDYQKNPSSMRSNDEQTIKYAPTAANPEKEAQRTYRTLKEARNSPYAKDALCDNSGMSKEGQKRLSQYETEYANRIKTVDQHTKNYKTSEKDNFTSLSGLDSYRLGPTIAAYTPEEYKMKYENAGSPDAVAKWMRGENFKHFDAEMAKEFGFKNPTQFKEWRTKNKLTIHESPEGMYLVPADVHNLERHSGQVSKIHQYLKGEITEEEYEQWKQKAKVEKIKQEILVRGQRAVIGAGKGAAINFGKQLVVFFAQETKVEFSNSKECSFIDHLKNILQNWFERIKKEWQNLLKNTGSNAISSLVMEAMNAIVDFFLHSFKNIAKMIRIMLNSIIRALRIIFSGNASWEERLYEAIKILSAGMVAFLGTGLNEVIKDFLSQWGPIAPAAPYIADVLSGLISCVLSSIVLCLFDRYKNKMLITSASLREDLLNTRLIYTNTSLALVSSIKAGKSVQNTVSVFIGTIETVATTKKQIGSNVTNTAHNVVASKKIGTATSNRISSLLEKENDEEDFE